MKFSEKTPQAAYSLALRAESAWLKGQLSTLEQRLAFAQAFFTALAKRHQGGQGSVIEGLKAIDSDLCTILKKLSYGGRTPQQVNPRRREWVESLLG